MVYLTKKINFQPILNSHQKGHLVILDTSNMTRMVKVVFLLILGLHFLLVILTHDYLTANKIENFHSFKLNIFKFFFSYIYIFICI
jgi:hypothetical protein